MLIKSSGIVHADAPAFEVKADSSGMVSGYGSVFGNVDLDGDRVLPGAFLNSLAKQLPKMLWQHDQHRPIGRWIEAREDSKGLFVSGQINLKTSAGRDAYEHIAAGDVSGMSIGYRIVKDAIKGRVRDLIELELFEVSVVTFPANQAAALGSVKALSSKDELIDLLRRAGLSKQAAALIAAGGWQALAKSDNGIDHDAAARLSAAIDNATLALRSLK